MKGVLLVNLGTPESPEPGAVGRYLLEFLSDERVVDLPRWLWLPLLRLVIVPLRKRRSAAAYRKVWTAEGSPLMVNSKALAARVAATLPDCKVSLAMRYGTPGVQEVLAEMRAAGVHELTVLPLYPQYSRTTTESVFDAVSAGLAALDWAPALALVRDYHDHPAWVSAVCESIRAYQRVNGKPERLLFSLHGIPQRYCAQGDPYAEQCARSVALVAQQLGLGEQDYQLCYQSRVGREPWLQPYTDKTLEAWAAAGVGTVQVVCPGFAVDCLETLEEIAMENRQRFESLGGKQLRYIPALNASEAHARVLTELVGQPPGEGSRSQSPV